MAARIKSAALPLPDQIAAAGLPVPVPEYRFSAARRFRFDWAWPALRLAIEVEGGTWLAGGGRHNRAAGYEKDCEKYSEAAILGWRLIRVTTRMVVDGRAMALIERALSSPPQMEIVNG